jgi:hypothetical protein
VGVFARPNVRTIWDGDRRDRAGYNDGMRRLAILALFAACGFRPIAGSPGDASGANLDALAACPTSYAPTNGSLYRVGPAADWLTAEVACEGDHAHLAVFDVAGESMTIDAISSATSTWVGLTDRRTLNVWKWVIGGSAPNQGNDPQNQCGRYRMAQMGMPGMLDNQDCSQTLPYVCECDQLAVDHASY